MTATEIRIAEPGDPYRDPPRNWRRIGALAGALVLLWVVVGAIGWVVMEIPSMQDDGTAKSSSSTPTVTVDSLLTAVYRHEDAIEAAAFICEAASVDAQTLVDERAARTAEHGPFGVSWTWEPGQGVPQGDRALMLVTLKYLGDGYSDAEYWNIALEKHDGWCVSAMTLQPSPGAS